MGTWSTEAIARVELSSNICSTGNERHCRREEGETQKGRRGLKQSPGMKSIKVD